MRNPWLANFLWSLASRSEALAFERGLSSVEAVQRALLRNLLARNRESGFGRAHGFSSLANAEAFRDKVPVADYEDMEPWIRRAARGEKALTSEEVLLLEPTGGSQGGSKWIPYTASLRREFQRGIAPWIRSLFRRHPAAMRGSAYWSISPPMDRRPPFETALKTGFESDADYLGPLGRFMESQVFAVPSSVLKEDRADAFFHRTALHLLAAEDLAFISVWNPTFLSLLLDRILAERESLLRGLRDAGKAARSRTVEKALNGRLGRTWVEIWPRLALISCWRDGWAQGPADRLAERFPKVAFQAKGLLATEALVSLPWHDPAKPRQKGPQKGSSNEPLPLLAYRSHFFEFEDVESGKTRFAWETKAGGTYSVLVTTGGGLYRYRLRDLVRIEGFRSACPVARFLRKEDSFSDLTGEKLQSDFVQHCAETAFKEAGVSGSFYLLAPEPESSPPRYALHVSLAGSAAATDKARRLEARMEAALEGNFQYGLSRKLGQLAPVRVVPAGPGAETEYYYYKSLRAKLGDVKWKPLESSGPWSDILRSKHP